MRYRLFPGSSTLGIGRFPTFPAAAFRPNIDLPLARNADESHSPEADWLQKAPLPRSESEAGVPLDPALDNYRAEAWYKDAMDGRERPPSVPLRRCAQDT